MRILALMILGITSLLSAGCTSEGVKLQKPLQGYWSDFHNTQHQISPDVSGKPLYN